MLIRDISNDPNQQIIQDYMSVLTGGRTVSVTLLYLLFAWRQKNITDENGRMLIFQLLHIGSASIYWR